MNKIKWFISTMIFIAILFSGCINNSIRESAKEPAQTSGVTETVTQMPLLTPAQTTIESVKSPELKIMSVTVSQKTASAVPVNIKIKNIGNATAKNVYAGVVGISCTPENLDLYNAFASKYPEEVIEFAHKAWLEGAAYKDTGFNITTKDTKIGDLILTGKLIAQEYIGDINPDDLKGTDFDVPFEYKKIIDCPENPGVKCSVSSEYMTFIKLAWTGDKKIYTVY